MTRYGTFDGNAFDDDTFDTDVFESAPQPATLTVTVWGMESYNSTGVSILQPWIGAGSPVERSLEQERHLMLDTERDSPLATEPPDHLL